MLTKAMQDALNDQIQKEFASAYLYLAMSAYCDAANLPGFAHWLRLQMREEAEHALKLLDHIQDRDGRVALQAIERPSADFASVLDVFQKTLEHERRVTESIHKLYALALKENDYPSQPLLHWFITEQVEEEKNALQIVEHLKLVGAQGDALLMLDRQMASRKAD